MRSAVEPSTGASMGYQRGLDGLRAISVLIVIVYHLHVLDHGFGWFKGGFIGVEVFFVVSGYLITSLLIQEWRHMGHIALGQFWLRRARRLLPALFIMMAASGVWASLAGERGRSFLRGLRLDTVWATVYVSNWSQIFGNQSYFSGPPRLLRHLWSLAVEEQFYLFWPLIFVGLMRQAQGRARQFLPFLVTFGLLAYVGMAVVWKAPTFESDSQQNWAYLATVLRAGGLLFGAALATVWTPWRWRSTGDRRGLDLAGFVSVIGIVAAGWVMNQSGAFLYRGGFVLIDVLSMVAIAAVVHPGAVVMRRVFGSAPLVAIGQRSYGLYLWHWPVFVGPFGESSSAERLIGGGVTTVVLSELCYRFVETPIRKGAIGRLRDAVVHRTPGAALTMWSLAGAAALLVSALGVRYTDAPKVDSAVGGDASFELPPAGGGQGATDGSVPASDGSLPATAVTASGGTVPATATAPLLTVPPSSAEPLPAPTLPVSVVIVGDSQAHSLAVNLPSGIESTFIIGDGSVEGCGVFEAGKVVTQRRGFSRNFAACEGLTDEWADSARAATADVALVVIGAWDVFDIATDAGVTAFATPEWDALFVSQVNKGIAALDAVGANVGLLEVPCMRPVESEGAGVPPLPERGDDTRVAHLNQLLRSIAAASGGAATFVPGPTAWCGDESINANLNYRWDGVHVYKPGAKLIFETVAQNLLDLSVTDG